MIFICYFVEFSRMFFVDNSKVKARDLNLHSKKKKNWNFHVNYTRVPTKYYLLLFLKNIYPIKRIGTYIYTRREKTIYLYKIQI